MKHRLFDRRIGAGRVDRREGKVDNGCSLTSQILRLAIDAHVARPCAPFGSHLQILSACVCTLLILFGFFFSTFHDVRLMELSLFSTFVCCVVAHRPGTSGITIDF